MNIIQSKDIICPKCNENILIIIKDYKINLYNCKNGHKINDILFNEFENTQKIDISKITCINCNKNNKFNSCDNEFFRCITCNSNLCPLCKSFHDKEHKIINYDKRNYICIKHNESFIRYCYKCKLNICIKCENEHKNHKAIYLHDLMSNNLLDEMNDFKKRINDLNENIKNIILKLNYVIYNIEIYYKISNNIIYNYEKQNNINYYTIKNIDEIINFKNIITEDIKKIIDENDIKNKMNYIINIYDKMNKVNNNNNIDKKHIEYINKINYNFIKDPKDLKYKLDITHTNDFYGINDIFELFISYKDNTEYLVSKNINNYNLDIYTLLNAKKILSLKAHKNHIKTIRYFINNKTYEEYLVSADDNGIVIIWEIGNYNIKYQIDTEYQTDYENATNINSCLLVFLKNDYLITSTFNISDDDEKSSTKIYSLKTGNFLKYIYNTKDVQIAYLLYWYNKKNDKHYIIQIAYGFIIIDNLLENVLYSELIQEPESDHDSGFIYHKDENDYLCCSSQNGYINIWDLYNKSIFKIINTNNCNLVHIIQWNEKYLIVADLNNKSFKIVNINNNEIIDIRGYHNEGIKCIKKIYHPIYGESLLSAGRDKTIKLLSI